MNHLRSLWPYLKPDQRGYLLALLLMPLVAGLNILQPILLKAALDGHIVAQQPEGLTAVALGYLGAVAGAFVLEGAYVLTLTVAAERTIFRLRVALFRQILSLSQRFYERQPTGQILTRATSDIEALSEALTAGSFSLVLDVLLMLGVLGTMLALDWKLTLLLLVMGPPIAAVIEFVRRRMKALFAEVRDALAAMNTYLAERLAGVEVLQLYGQEARAAARFRALDEQHRDANVSNNFYDASLYAFIDGIASVCVAMILAWGAQHVEAGAGSPDALTVGLVVAFVDYIDRLFRPLRELSGKITFIQRAITALDKVFWLLGVEERITPGSLTLDHPAGRLSLRGVSFRYRPDGPDILKDVDLEIAPGEVVAVVGRTGSGKSTLVRLLSRVHDGYTGSILVDGQELRDIAPASIRRAIGAVRQEVQLFTDTLRFNVTLGDPQLDPARVEEAITLSNLHTLAARYPEGLDTLCRERGAALSVGEAQILSLARTLARDPAIVLLDEATASVDPVTEQLLQQAMEQVFARKTSLVIAHRLSTITHADRILVMDAGRIIEQGSHAALMAAGGAYAALYREGFKEPAEAAKTPASAPAGA